MPEQKEKTGRLERSPYAGRLGINGPSVYYHCVDCGSEFPVLDHVPTSYSGFVASVEYELRDGTPSCNGHKITLCPWCRPDSKQFMYGRGA